MSHISQVSVSATVIGLSEYRGLEMKLPVALLAAENYSEGILTVPCAIFKLSCQNCHSEDFPLTSKDVRTFRSLHEAHIESTCVHVVTHTALGEIIAQAISVQAQSSDHQLAIAVGNQPFSSLVMSRAQQLQNLWLSLSCMPRGLDCRRCHSKQYFEDCSQSADFLAEHRDHIQHLYVHVSVIEPQEYEGLRLRLLAHTFPERSLTAPMRIDCIMLELAANDGTSQVTPRSRTDIDRYLDSLRGCRGARLRTLVYGRAGRIFERQIDVGRAIHSNSVDRSEKCPKQNVHPNPVEREHLVKAQLTKLEVWGDGLSPGDES